MNMRRDLHLRTGSAAARTHALAPPIGTASGTLKVHSDTKDPDPAMTAVVSVDHYAPDDDGEVRATTGLHTHTGRLPPYYSLDTVTCLGGFFIRDIMYLIS
jgi:hypothetical protein